MSFRLKIILGVACIEALLLAILIFSSLDYLRRSNEDELSKRAHTAARLFATTTKNAVLASDLASLESVVREVLTNPGIEYARVRGRKGMVLAEGGKPDMLHREFRADGEFDDDEDDVFDVFEEIEVAGLSYGRVEIGLATRTLRQVLEAARHQAGLIAAIEMVLVALLSFALGSYLTRGLSHLQQASRQIAGGELGFRLEVRGRDELAETARAFNEMSRQLEEAAARRNQAEAEVVRYRDHLEQLVTQRTEELTQANEGLRQANREIAEVQNQLLQSEKMASIGQLAAGVAHEINNPIGFVNSNLGTLRRYVAELFEVLSGYEKGEAEMAPETRAALIELKRQIDIAYLREDVGNLLSESMDGLQRVKCIVQDLKDFSHVDANKKQWANLEQGLDSTLNVVSNELEYKAEIVKEYAGIPEIECMPSQLNQVFLNLLMNAAQAIEDHGRITVRTGQDENNVWVEVEDSGKGIEPEHLGRIFDPFFTTKPVGAGTGLGLSLSYGIVQQHGGRIEVNSEPGKGSVFRVVLPKHAVPAQSSATPNPD